MKQYGPTYQPRPVANKEDIERELRVKRHERWINSNHYNYVIEIIREWAKEFESIDQFSEESLVSATPEEVKNQIIVSKKCKKEAENLVKLLS